MPSRIIREGINTSLAVNGLSSGAEIFYRRLLNAVDDFGRYHAMPQLLRAALFPLKIDVVKDAHVGGWLAETVKQGLVRAYTHDGVPYLEVVKFGQQVRAKKSKYPHPPSTCVADAKHLQANAPVVVVESVVESESESEGEVTTLPPAKETPVPPKPDPLFDAFWGTYPKQLQDSKKKCREIWKRLGQDERAAAVEGVKVFAAIVTRAPPDRRRFFKRSTTWLNQQCWETPVEALQENARGDGGHQSSLMTGDQSAEYERELESYRNL